MRVILATDGSIEADVAEAVCSKLPLPPGSRWIVAMVTHQSQPVGAGFMPEAMGAVDTWMGENMRIQRMVSERTVQRVVERLTEAGHEAEGARLEGDPAEEIERLAEERDAHLVVVGSGLDSNFAAFLLGSVSRRLVLHSPRSVLVGKHYDHVEADGTHDRLRRTSQLSAILAVDGSPGAEQAVKSLEGVRRKVFSTLYTLTVEATPSWPGGLVPEGAESGALKVAEEAAARLKECAEHVVPLSSSGRPSIVLVGEARKRNLDLILVGATRHSTLDRILAGSCAYETATSAPCSVLVVRDALPFA